MQFLSFVFFCLFIDPGRKVRHNKPPAPTRGIHHDDCDDDEGLHFGTKLMENMQFVVIFKHFVLDNGAFSSLAGILHHP